MAKTIDLASQMRASAEKAAKLLRALGNEDRLLLLCELSQESLCVSDLERRTGILQPTLSQQLAVLRSQDLVATRREGKRIIYSIDDRKALAVLRTLHKVFCKDAAGDD